MFRTRDFLLIFVTVVFLMIAIGVTVTRQHLKEGEESLASVFVNSIDKEYTAELAAEVSLSREERVAEMRRKIAEKGEIVLNAPETTTVALAAEEADSHPELAVSAPSVEQCSGYGVYSGNWSPQGVQIELSEGARIVYRREELVQTTGGTSTLARKDVLMQLPSYPVYTGTTCLSSDVVGVAQDGSLIRNDEVGLYGVFGEHTLIGYALDGFPIHGVSTIATDACGGTMVAGEYHYYLSDERETVLNCFSATPIKL